MKTEMINFPARQDRTGYVARYFADCLKGKVLDVGCDQGVLRNLVSGIEYVGIDAHGAPDIQLDLERAEKLPFADSSFDCVLCIDVLEHLDNLHKLFAELIRVTAGNLIISLPNCWCGARRPIERGKGSFAHYGLPPERPMDRHKWFFSVSEAKSFVEAQSRKFGVTVADMHLTEKPRSAIVRGARRLKYWNPEHYANRYAHTMWVRFEVAP